MIEVGQSGNTCKKRSVVPEYRATTLNLGRRDRFKHGLDVGLYILKFLDNRLACAFSRIAQLDSGDYEHMRQSPDNLRLLRRIVAQ